ncbi:MAG: non-canonical purine NTP pyrophosphatase, partial [Solirubrobacterales bacterium]|nr:non-canonical purine NTP pyrophosphatase [Solirubrobacterales bacterium]
MRVVLATRNSHKLREFERLIGGEVGLDPLPDELELPPETGSTYAE